MNRPRINWGHIAKAVDHYRNLGYKYIEVPWIISEEALSVTLPPNKIGHRTADGPLVGSAEQGFIQLYLDGELEINRYVACSPCFRDDEVDEFHQRYFFKVELMHVLEPWGSQSKIDPQIKSVAHDALSFFNELWGTQGRMHLVTTDDGCDIELNGIEIGSYGYRNYKDLHWIYGTGLAEPRFSQAINLG